MKHLTFIAISIQFLVFFFSISTHAAALNVMDCEDIEVTICSGETYTFEGIDYDVTGMYTLTSTTCDGTFILDLTVIPKPPDSVTQADICSGESYTWSENGQIYTITGLYEIINDGCTADDILDLIVEPKPADSVTDVTICSGETYTWAVNGSTYTESGTYEVINDGCTADDILNLTALDIDKPDDIVSNATICSGENYTWAVNGVTYTVSGTYIEESDDCSADEVLNLSVIPKPDDSVTDATICSGETYTWAADGQVYTISGTYFVINDGCTADDILNLTVLPKPEDEITEILADCGGSYTWPVNGQTYNEAGTYEVINDGCTADQILILEFGGADYAIICEDDSYLWAVNDSSYTVRGNHSDTLIVDDQECFYYLTLTIIPADIDSVITITLPGEDEYFWPIDGMVYTGSGTVSYDLSDCNSSITLDYDIGTILALDDVTFTGEYNEEDNQVDLNWSAISEDRIDRYTIQKAIYTPIFESIKTVEATNESSYSYQDTDIQDGLHYYRLMVTRFDGTIEYSDIITISPNHQEIGMSISPNPTHSQFDITITSEAKSISKISIHNEYGQHIESQETFDKKTSIDCSTYPSGLYFISVINSDKRIMKKVVVL